MTPVEEIDPEADSEAVRARLRDEARERWGEQWFLESREWADGDARHRVIHRRGRPADADRLEQDELYLDDTGEVVVERVTVRQPERAHVTWVDGN